MTTTIKADQFFTLWKETCEARHATLLRDWNNCRDFTSHVLHGSDSMIATIASRLGLNFQCNYYFIDAILFTDSDVVPSPPDGEKWVRRIRIAFEHENYFRSGLFSETSNLLIIDCDLRVLISYPANITVLRKELDYLHGVVSGSDRATAISDAESLLFIIGWPGTTNGMIDWEGYIYTQDSWQRLSRQKPQGPDQATQRTASKAASDRCARLPSVRL